MPLPQQAIAQTTLTKAVIQHLRNRVRLTPLNRRSRPAQISDALTPGDSLTTGRSAMAELRFNDGSLARIGERAVFRFTTNTRKFRLSTGTVLLLIPPGQGKTDVYTPNAAAAIRGSALFVRYIPQTNTTIIGSLTDSNIEVFNHAASASEVLAAGEMAVVVDDKIDRLYEFELDTFYQTSDLVRELNLDRETDAAANSDPAIAEVQAETAAAAIAQPPFTGAEVIENPAFIQLPDSDSPASPTEGNSPDSGTKPATDGNPPDQPPDSSVPDNNPEEPSPADNSIPNDALEALPETTPTEDKVPDNPSEPLPADNSTPNNTPEELPQTTPTDDTTAPIPTNNDNLEQDSGDAPTGNSVEADTTETVPIEPGTPNPSNDSPADNPLENDTTPATEGASEQPLDHDVPSGDNPPEPSPADNNIPNHVPEVLPEDAVDDNLPGIIPTNDQAPDNNPVPTDNNNDD